MITSKDIKNGATFYTRTKTVSEIVEKVFVNRYGKWVFYYTCIHDGTCDAMRINDIDTFLWRLNAAECTLKSA